MQSLSKCCTHGGNRLQHEKGSLDVTYHHSLVLKDLPALIVHLPSRLPGLCHPIIIEGTTLVSFEALVSPQLVCKGVHPLRQISFDHYYEPIDASFGDNNNKLGILLALM